MPPPSTLPLILPLGSALVILSTHIVLYHAIFHATINFLVFHFVKSWVKECHRFPDVPGVSVDFFAFFANSLSMFRPFFSTENQPNFLSENQSNPILLREIVTPVEDSQ